MDTATSHLPSGVSPSAKWSLFAGLYALVCSTALLLVLYPVSNTLVKILGGPTGFSPVVLASPVVVFGPIAWWILVERRSAYTYPAGGIAGVVAALFTNGFWLVAFALVWGPRLVLVGGVIVLFVLAVTTPVAFVAGVSMMFVRRQLSDHTPSEDR